MSAIACKVGHGCDDPTHYRYRLWPIDVPLPAVFHDGTWPDGRTQRRRMRLWGWARSKGIIRAAHL